MIKQGLKNGIENRQGKIILYAKLSIEHNFYKHEYCDKHVHFTINKIFLYTHIVNCMIL